MPLSSNKDLFGCLQIYCSDIQVQFIKFIALDYLLSANKITAAATLGRTFLECLQVS